MPPRSAEQLKLALNAPPRPELSDCQACDCCDGGDCDSWRELRSTWVQSWRGKPPPEEAGAAIRDWWKGAKTQHKALLAAAKAAGKRPAQAGGTPNKA